MDAFNKACADFLDSLNSGTHAFAQTLSFVDNWYDFAPTAFQNGPVGNSAEQNQGSCKVLALSQLLNLSKEQTLCCFGEHYRDVLATPGENNHHNLRRLLQDGVTEIQFTTFPLTRSS
ncbi:HopJ type III effector protein [Parendozoicomonas haliclonae]|uniref:HopJ type III effector protein n=2 Tax=Parendozoicomonas haliclonae TaxID=1960125 RepID=A0A1X7AMC6_9GAMM|nr:HopJ type III effector protein [Parendozoicomonas haliclonae]SMA49329.1 HopJ type III effector protein [Parendozoicomonas haliclonae]